MGEGGTAAATRVQIRNGRYGLGNYSGGRIGVLPEEKLLKCSLGLGRVSPHSRQKPSCPFHLSHLGGSFCPPTGLMDFWPSWLQNSMFLTGVDLVRAQSLQDCWSATGNVRGGGKGTEGLVTSVLGMCYCCWFPGKRFRNDVAQPVRHLGLLVHVLFHAEAIRRDHVTPTSSGGAVVSRWRCCGWQ